MAADAEFAEAGGGLSKKERVARYGEVFTPDWVVRAMCDMLEREAPEAFRPEKTFLEPTCGEGVFVCEVLRRKFANCRTDAERRTALRSVWAMEIQADNVEKTIQAVTALCEGVFRLNKADRETIRDHIIQADALKVMKLLDAGNNDTIITLNIGRSPVEDTPQDAAE